MLFIAVLHLSGCTASSQAQGEQAPNSSPPACPELAPLLPRLARRGLNSPEEIRAYLLNANPLDIREHRWLLETLGDAVTLSESWGALARENPKDAEAAWEEAKALYELGRVELALKQLNDVVKRSRTFEDELSPVFFRHDILPLRCQLERAQNTSTVEWACRAATEHSPKSLGPRMLASWLLVQGRTEEALKQSQESVRRNATQGGNWYVLGNTLAALGRQQEAMAAWRKALTHWPDFSPSVRRLERQDAEPLQQRITELKWERLRAAARLNRCGHLYLALGLPERAERCFQAASANGRPSGVAGRVAHLAEQEPRLAEQQAREALLDARAPLVLTALARILHARGESQEALSLLTEARGMDAVNPLVISALIDVCQRQQGDARCMENMSTAPLAEGSPKEELTRKPVATLDSRIARYTPPTLREILLVPMGDSPLPELEGIEAVLGQRFPGFTFRLAPARPVPPHTLNDEDARYIVYEYLLAALPETPGLVALVSHVLVTEQGGAYYGLVHTQKGRAVVSVSPLRHPEGDFVPVPPPDAQTLAMSRRRVQDQLTSTVAKVLGLSFPCQESRCVLSRVMTARDIDAKGSHFCAKHQEELSRLPRP